MNLNKQTQHNVYRYKNLLPPALKSSKLLVFASMFMVKIFSKEIVCNLRIFYASFCSGYVLIHYVYTKRFSGLFFHFQLYPIRRTKHSKPIFLSNDRTDYVVYQSCRVNNYKPTHESLSDCNYSIST